MNQSVPALPRPKLLALSLLVLVLFCVSFSSAATRTVNISNFAFTDTVSNNSTTIINAGDTVHWVWQSGTHSTTSGTCSGPGSCTASGTWDSTILSSPNTFNFTFSSAGTFPYYCRVHTTAMLAQVIVNPVVTNTNDSGAGSLRQAILDFNANTSMTAITFNIPGAGIHTITPLSALPVMTHSGILDGTSQPGWAAGIPLIELDGASAGPSANGLSIQSGNTTVQGLIINRFSQNGIVLASTTNLVQGNFIGTNSAGTAAQPNGGDGILIFSGQFNNTIGGTTAAARNVISGNTLYGVEIVGLGTTGNVVQGNFIGVDANGVAAVGNGSGGVHIGSSASNTTVGGTATGAGNVISGNFGDGITINGSATSNTVLGNLIGSDAQGTTALGNTQNGIQINGASNNTIGGTSAAARNVISGNSGSAVLLTNAGANGNLVMGNYMGTNKAGVFQMGNGNQGVLVSNGASSNTIGAAVFGGGNVISGNAGGVTLTGSGTNANLVQGNFIGLNANGNGGLGNGGGVTISSGAGNNTIGGTTTAARNVISSNFTNGVFLSNVSANLVQGNYIGTDLNGIFAIGNQGSGVVITGPGSNTIGGSGPGAGNLISGNVSDGVNIAGGASANSVQGNFIGLDATGNSAIGNRGNGINLSGGASNNTLGSAIAGNVISGNAVNGILISGSGTNANQVLGNRIGTNAANTGGVGNAGDGVRVDLGAANNRIGVSANNIIAYNGKGVVITGGSATVGNEIESNAIFSNVGLGIDLNDDGVTLNTPGGPHVGPNNLQNFPVLATAVSSGGTTTVTGTLNSIPSTSFHIELFGSQACDPSGFGQGLNLLGAKDVTTDGSGNAPVSFSFSTSLIGPGFLTATATDPSQNTSEFSACLQPDAPLTNVAGRTLHVRLGKPFTFVVASFTDTDSGGTASQFTTTTIDWGDGTAPSAATVVSAGGQNYNVMGTHTYTRVGGWTVTVTINDSGGQTATATSKARLWPKPLSY